MKNRIRQYAVVAVLLLVVTLISCSSGQSVVPVYTDEQVYNKSEYELAATMGKPVGEAFPLTSEQRRARVVSKQLLPFMSLDDDTKTYSLDISDSQRRRLNISKKEVEAVRSQIDDVNRLLQQIEKEGKGKPLPTPQELLNGAFGSK